MLAAAEMLARGGRHGLAQMTNKHKTHFAVNVFDFEAAGTLDLANDVHLGHLNKSHERR
jgi:hypothetical protein